MYTWLRGVSPQDVEPITARFTPLPGTKSPADWSPAVWPPGAERAAGVAAWCVWEATRLAPGLARGWRSLAQWMDGHALALDHGESSSGGGEESHGGGEGGGGDGDGGSGASTSFAVAELIDDIDGICGGVGMQGLDGGGTTIADGTSRAVNMYAQATRAHFKYLALVSSDSGNSAALGSLQTMLRLLSIAARAASAPVVADEFAHGLRSVPAAPWAAVAPQLLALLRSDAASVRGVARAVLCAVAAAVNPEPEARNPGPEALKPKSQALILTPNPNNKNN